MPFFIYDILSFLAIWPSVSVLWNYIYDFILKKLNYSVAQGKKGKIVAALNKKSRLEARTPLSNDYRTGADELPSETLDSQPLRMTVAAV